MRHGPIISAPIQLSHPAPGGGDTKGKKKEEEEVIDPRRSGVGGGDVVRDCAVVEYVFFLLLLSLPLPSSLLPALLPSFLVSSHLLSIALVPHSCPDGELILDSLPSYVIHS